MSISSSTGTANKNPFYDPEDDVDDDTFVNYRSRAYDNAETNIYNQKRQQLLDERREIEKRTLQNSNAAVRALYETEQIGMSAAEELVRQGEQLKNVDRNLDDINNTTKTTQKYLTSMKSMFSGFKNYFGGSNSTDNSSSQTKSLSPEEQTPSALTSALNKVKGEAETARQSNHPALRSRFDTSGFKSAFDDDDDDDNNDQRYSNARTLTKQESTKPKSYSNMVEDKVDHDLNQLSSGMSRLKVLAQGLSTELDEQLDIINNIDNKVDQADQTIRFQTNQMNRLLKK